MHSIAIQKHRSRGFSLVEIIVVLGIIIGLSTIVFGYIQSAQDSSERTQLFQDLNFIRAAQSSFRLQGSGGYADTLAKLGLGSEFSDSDKNPGGAAYSLLTGTFTGTKPKPSGFEVADIKWALVVTAEDNDTAEAVEAYFDNLGDDITAVTKATAPTLAVAADADGKYAMVLFKK